MGTGIAYAKTPSREELISQSTQLEERLVI
jgi:hypothetical protein